MVNKPDLHSLVVNGIHDMGGMHGFGPIVIEANEPVFHANWEGKVRAIFSETVGRYYNLDEFRHVIERMEPAAYLEAVYYERWLHAVETLLDEKGVLAAGAAPAPQAPHKRPANLPAPRFKAGDRVIARNMHPEGHTRLPRYARGKSGVVTSVKGPFLLPDANAHGNHDVWEYVYPVRFAARELWGAEASGRDSVSVDLWESYLEAVR
jgi:nitrile hydratase